MRGKAKVFGIGFHKTGTTSLARALYILGYNVTGYFGDHDLYLEENVFEQVYRRAKRYDAAQDMPWPILYKELDRWFPGSKFILTVRDSESWIRSVKGHFKRQHIPAHEWIYGVRCAIGNEPAYIHRYQEHNRTVMDYFTNRPDDLLIMDITAGDGWEKLCPFLNADRPPFDFPIANTTQERTKNWTDRGRRFLSRKLDPDDTPTIEWGGNAAFLRDILHYYYSVFDELWSGVNRLQDELFIRRDAGQENSVRDILLRLIYEEYIWYQRLIGEPELYHNTNFGANHQTREDLFHNWSYTRFLLRQHAANLTESDIFAKIPNQNELIREVYLHLLCFGMQQGSNISRRLQDFGVWIKIMPLTNFFYDEVEHNHPNL